ncbi:MAG: hypothetical protein A3D92_17000 [Bacteroidetes bacterium RIFCSPHIGHO2_02_FULL_44_7]|nr:MAG: hypothetical protein A3D92_17000 [Bacteroidetes bacterium RIFCSPHIGHO2_02_FULL_44_7]
MDYKGTDFPQYRKLSNEKAYYRITGARHWDEIQIIGTKALRHSVQAQQYPEILRIQDMLNLAGGFYLLSTASEFEEVMAAYQLE